MFYRDIMIFTVQTVLYLPITENLLHFYTKKKNIIDVLKAVFLMGTKQIYQQGQGFHIFPSLLCPHKIRFNRTTHTHTHF